MCWYISTTIGNLDEMISNEDKQNGTLEIEGLS